MEFNTEFLISQAFDSSAKQFVCNNALLDSLLVNEELTTIRLQIKMITEALVDYLVRILSKSNVKSVIVRLHGVGQMQTGFKEGEIYACTLDEEEIDLIERKFGEPHTMLLTI
jgi:hypothetical protein